MKHFKLISVSCLAVIVVATLVMSWCVCDVYKNVRSDVMRTVAECVRRADVMELISRMESPFGRADEAAVRLGSYVAAGQSKDGLIVASDTLKTSLAALLRFGLDFGDGREHTDFQVLDSILRCELHRYGLYPEQVFVLPPGVSPGAESRLWSCEYRITPVSDVEYIAYISPLDAHILQNMSSLIISGVVLVLAVAVIVVYLIMTVKRMRTIEQMKDDFTHNMTHELKTPVAVAMSAADSLLRYYDPSDETRNRRMLGIVVERLGALTDMIEKILSVSMERFRHVRLNIMPVNVVTVIDEAVRQIKIKAEKEVNITVSVDPVELVIEADPLHFSNILSNLLDNAVKYSEGSVNIAVRASAHGLTVEDDGIGIDNDDLPHIFDKFYRATDGDRYRVSGFGIGLYYVRHIVDLMGWSITVGSRKGSGTNFTIVWYGEKR